MQVEINYAILNSTERPPVSRCTVYVDGAAGSYFREDTDIELSHWLPNRTPKKYRAGTSTEICFKYLKDNPDYPYDLVVNDHMDVDGILSVFTLSYPSIALQYETEITQASKTGDFWSYSAGKAFKLFQELTKLYQSLQTQNNDLQTAYIDCLHLVAEILTTRFTPSPEEKILKKQLKLVTSGGIKRQEISDRMVSYFVPKKLALQNLEGYLTIPKFNESISARIALWPQVRNYYDPEKVQLVAVESDAGIYYDLFYPGYTWADTQGLWIPSGLIHPDNLGEGAKFQTPALIEAIDSLNKLEPGEATWMLFTALYFSNTKNPRGFPAVATTLGEEENLKPSKFSMDEVINVLTPPFTDLTLG